MKITEEYVILFWRHLVLQECKNSYKGLEPEDRTSEGNLALLHAVRTYRRYYGGFPEYAVSQMRRIMKQQNTKAWAEKKSNARVSLDAPLGYYNKGEKNTFANCIGQRAIDHTSVEVDDFVSRLSAQEQKIIKMRMDGHSCQSISNILVISPHKILHIVDDIKKKYQIYYT